MADTDWRVWLFDRLRLNAPLTTLLPAVNMFGAGSLTVAPEVKPFMVIRLEPEQPGPYPGSNRARATLWVHDEPGDYMRIDAVLKAAKTALVGAAQVAPAAGVGAIACAWRGNSSDLSDPDYKTIMRNSTYDLIGKDGNA